MVGKGSVNHNTRKFHAENTDPERSHLNHSYNNENIKDVYHELFDEAVARYNSKQTRNDRMINNYYEKIRSGKQEKLFHEVILQIGNCDDMNAKSENGNLSVKILDEYVKDFQSRNPNLRVFSAHLHMDEATPHLHIDFVPYTTGSTRGLDTRISLKQALSAQGFKGGSRSETEWNQWVLSEKQHLSSIMERHGIEWEQKGTHEKHLSVLEYEKKVRSKEVAALETKSEKLSLTISKKEESADIVEKRLKKLEKLEKTVILDMDEYETSKKWQLPEPVPFMSAKSYKTKTVLPFIAKLKEVIKTLVYKCLRLMANVKNLTAKLADADYTINNLRSSLSNVKNENSELTETANDFKRVRNVLGDNQVDDILLQAKLAEQAEKTEQQATRSKKKSYYER